MRNYEWINNSEKRFIDKRQGMICFVTQLNLKIFIIINIVMFFNRCINLKEI